MDDSSGNIDQQLLAAYRNTTYRVFTPDLAIRIGIDNDELNTFLFDNNAFSWAFISAANPGSEEQLPASINQKRHQQLIQQVLEGRWRYCEAAGQPDSADWQPEPSLLILDISQQEALALGRAFQQKAIVFGLFEQPGVLLFCH
ncbi:MAG: DUF3293 domain-containing protein [Bacteroidota bacterium]